tara:strand:- start:13 stop:522 length:510 start_codon:yes stop_codon:yes gene_type:complete
MNNCTICFENISFEDNCITNCNHNFCEKCLDGWFKKNKDTCPLCRTKIEYYKCKDETIKLYFVNSSNTNTNTSLDFLNNFFNRYQSLKRYVCFATIINLIQFYFLFDNGINYNILYMKYDNCLQNYTDLNKEYNSILSDLHNTEIYNENDHYIYTCSIPQYFLNKCKFI